MAKFSQQHVNNNLCRLSCPVLALIAANIHFNRDHRLIVFDPLNAHNLRRCADMLTAAINLPPSHFKFAHHSPPCALSVALSSAAKSAAAGVGADE